MRVKFGQVPWAPSSLEVAFETLVDNVSEFTGRSEDIFRGAFQRDRDGDQIGAVYGYLLALRQFGSPQLIGERRDQLPQPQRAIARLEVALLSPDIAAGVLAGDATAFDRPLFADDLCSLALALFDRLLAADDTPEDYRTIAVQNEEAIRSACEI